MFPEAAVHRTVYSITVTHLGAKVLEALISHHSTLQLRAFRCSELRVMPPFHQAPWNLRGFACAFHSTLEELKLLNYYSFNDQELTALQACTKLTVLAINLELKNVFTLQRFMVSMLAMRYLRFGQLCCGNVVLWENDLEELMTCFSCLHSLVFRYTNLCNSRALFAVLLRVCPNLQKLEVTGICYTRCFGGVPPNEGCCQLSITYTAP